VVLLGIQVLMYVLMQGCTSFPKIMEPPQNCRFQEGGMKPFPYRGPASIKRHCKKFNHPGKQYPGFLHPCFNVFRKTIVFCPQFEKQYFRYYMLVTLLHREFCRVLLSILRLQNVLVD
jgi:hypothetical protein